MAKKFSFNIPLYTEAITDKFSSLVVETTNDLYFEILKNSPVHTGTYIQQNVNEGVKQEGDTVIGRVSNEGEYPEKVEGGWRKKTPVNWHLRSGEVYFAIGAHPFERSLKKVEFNFYKKIHQKLG